MPFRASAVAVLSLSALLAGCATAGMTVPPELAGVEAMQVEGRGGWRGSQRAAFGPFEATDVERSWTKGSGWRVGVGPLGGGSDRAAQEYAFTFRADGIEEGIVRCLAAGSRGSALTAVVDVELAARETLECRPDAAPGAAPEDEPAWDLVLAASRDRHLEGFVRIGDERYPVVSTGPGGKLAPASAHGFEVRSGERVVAAVEVVNDGAVWLVPDLAPETRTTLAAVAAALLLYDRVQPQ